MTGIRRLVVVITCILLFWTIGIVSGSEQTPEPNDAEEDGAAWIDGTPLIRAIREEQDNGSPYAMSDSEKEVPMTYNYTPGDVKTFICADFVTEEDYTVNATCEATGEHCYVFVGENLNLAHKEALDLADTFDHIIHPAITGTFGNETGVDRDPRVFILVLEIRDTAHYNNTDFSVGGYFDGSTTNNIDIVFLNINQWGRARESTLAHEYQHLIHNSHDPYEKTWVEEGCSGYAEYLCFGTRSRAKVQAFTRRPETPLVVTDSRWHLSEDKVQQAHYGASFLWTLYLAENFGDGSRHPGNESFLRGLVADDLPGIRGINATLDRHGFTERFEDVFKQWVIANYLDAEGYSPPFGYAAIDLSRYPQRTGWIDLAERSGSAYSFPAETLQPWSAAYYEVGTTDPGTIAYTNDRDFWMGKFVNRDGEAVIVVSPLDDRGEFVLTVSEGAGNRTAGTAANVTESTVPLTPIASPAAG